MQVTWDYGSVSGHRTVIVKVGLVEFLYGGNLM